MKKILALLMVVMLSACIGAVDIENLDIRVSVDAEGKATVSEDYILQFTSPFEEQEFAQKAIENSSSIGAWQVDYSFFYPRFGSGTQGIATSKITYDGAAKKIGFVYELREKFASLVLQEQRTDTFIIDDRQLATFIQSGTVVIPDNVTLTIVLPSNSEINSGLLPQNAIVEGNRIILHGLQSNSIEISYKVLKPIAPGGNELILFLTNYYWAIIVVAAIAGALIYSRRKKIEQKIEDYLVSHSELKGKLPDADSDIDVD